MIVKRTREISERLAYHSIKDRLNIKMNTYFTDVVNKGFRIDDCFALDSSAESTKRILGCSKKEAIVFTMLNAITDYNAQFIFSQEEFLKVMSETRIFHKNDFSENAYLKNIHLEEAECGNFQITHDFYWKYETFMYDIPRNDDGVMIPRIGMFDGRFKYPCIRENNVIWMSITPNEIFTMETPIEEAFGNVLTLGCGMGYFAYMASEKENVTEVTIIEKNPEVIDLFNKYILPQFGHKEKISVIQADAIEYIQALPDGKFDYCFADIWTGNMDWQPYIALKMMCSKFNQMKITYWIEDAIGASMMDVIKHLILQASLKHIIKNPDDSIYDFDSMTLAFFKDLLKNVEITNKEQVDFYMDYKNIIDMIGNNERKNK